MLSHGKQFEIEKMGIHLIQRSLGLSNYCGYINLHFINSALDWIYLLKKYYVQSSGQVEKGKTLYKIISSAALIFMIKTHNQCSGQRTIRDQKAQCCAGACLIVGSLEKKNTDFLMFADFHGVNKYSHSGQFQATNMMSLKVELGRDVRD